MPETDKQQLATHILGEPVTGWIRRRHQAGCAYAEISAELDELTDGKIKVTRQAIHQWLRPTDRKRP